MSATSSNKYIIGLDVGTTSIRCHIINSKAECVSVSSKQINLLYPKLGYVEINPEELWNSVCDVIKQAVKNANISPLQIASLGLCTQRATFVTWRKDNGQPFHNFITWKDLRANALVQQWRNSVLIKGLQMTCYVLYLVSRNKRCHAASSLKLLNTQVTLRLLWALQNIPELKEAVRNKNALFGTIDTWLIYKFTAGQKHVTDITNASATGFYDPFFLTWSSWAKVLFKIPYDILPEVVDNDYSFGSTQMSTFGFSVPITCVISDQSASTFGSCCFNAGDIKITLGTGSFLDVNTRYNIYSSAAGLYPLVGWKIDNDITYFIEGACNDAGSVIQWALKTNLIEDVQESSALANTVDHTDGVYFIPAFSGLGVRIIYLLHIGETASLHLCGTKLHALCQ